MTTSRRTAALAVAAAGLALGAALWRSSRPEPSLPPAPAHAPEPPANGAPTPDAAPGAPSEAAPDDAPTARRTPSQWREVREAAAAAWEEEARGVVHTFCERRSLPDADCEAILDALSEMHAELAAVRADIEEGAIAPAEGRERIRALRDRIGQHLVAVLGEPDAEALREALSSLRGGGF